MAEPTRREFLVASALGLLVGRAAGHEGERARGTSSEASQPGQQLLYVGTYTENGRTEGIHLVRFDTRTGALRLDGSVDAGPNPSFLALHPKGHTLYAVNETTERAGKESGGVSAFSVAQDSGALTRINEQATEGGAPCYVSVDRSGRFVLVANYVGGNVVTLPIGADGALGVVTSKVQHFGTGPNAERQEKAHAHCIMPDQTNRFALATDLGIDHVVVYGIDAEARKLVPIDGGVHLQPGAGPRHLAYHPRLPLVYVANELDSTVAVLSFDRQRATLAVVQTLSALPADWKEPSFAADIHFARDGRTLYVSNRGHNSIAVFRVGDTGVLTLDQTVSTGGDWPRNFSLDPSGRWLLVANQRSGSIIVLQRDAESGRLTPTSQRLEVASPVCLRFSAPVP